MKKSLFLWMLLVTLNSLFSQEKVNVVEQNIVTNNKQQPQTSPLDSINVEQKLVSNPKKENQIVPLDSIKNMYGGRYVDYKIINHAYDTIQIDTTLTIQKYFNHNYTQKDDFEWLAMANQGQTFNKLGYHFINNNIIPQFGFTAKLYNYDETEDMEYYHVPTPTTILFYRSGFDGQVLNSKFTTNFGKHQNFFMGYKGLRSVGDYQETRSSHINFRVGYSYYNPEKRYQFRTHIISQKIDNQENGGLTEETLDEFKADNPDFSARGRVNVNLYNSESFLKTSRYYYEHELRILNSKDSLHQNLTNLKLGNSIALENRKYKFISAASDSDFFTKENPSIYGTQTNEETSDRTEFNTSKNQVYLKFNSPWILGNFKVFGSLYQTSRILNYTVARELNYASFGGNWNSKYKGIFLNAYGEQIINGANLGTNIHVNAGYKLKDHMSITGGIQLKSAAPNTTATLFQSNFSNLSWNQNLDNEIYRTLYGSLKTKWLNADVYLHQIKNYVYFNQNSVATQYNQTIDYLKVKLSNELKFGHFRFNNSVLIQKIAQGDEALRLPEFVTRNILYYENYLFKGNPLLAQIGISFKYFTKYLANQFNPVLNEFYIQNDTEIGAYPTFDVFVNGEVRRTRIYFKVENITASFTGRNYLATPNQPASDLTMRLGLVWNFWN